MSCLGREILEHDFGGDLQAYAENYAGPKPKGVDDDPFHPWHLRVQHARETVDLPDDCILPPDVFAPYTRREICEKLDISDSCLAKWGLSPKGKSGKYALYDMSDAFHFAVAVRLRADHRRRHGANPPESLEQMAARLQAEAGTEDGFPKYWRPKWWPGCDLPTTED